MKLNLLPTHVSRPNSGLWAIPLSILLAVGGVAALFYFKITSEKYVENAKARREAAVSQAELAVKVSKDADQDLMNARGLILNINMAEAMTKHNTVYTSLYEEVRKYIPNFYRVTSMNASPNGAEQCTVTITGVLKSFQEYADLQLALLRIPGATTVGRVGFTGEFGQRQNVQSDDQIGRMLYPNQPRMTDDQMANLEAQIADAAANTRDFDNVGNFGSTDVTDRGAMTGHSLVSVSVTLPRNLTVPDPHSTLATSASLWPAPTAPTGTAPTTGTPTPSPSAPGRPASGPPTNLGPGGVGGQGGPGNPAAGRGN